MVIKQYDVSLISLAPTIGHEIKKSRPCVIISPNEINKYISTVIIAPMTSHSHYYPTRVPVKFRRKDGWVVLDQLCTINKKKINFFSSVVSFATIHPYSLPSTSSS